jgi:serine/threonine protein phosphatase PrpC
MYPNKRTAGPAPPVPCPHSGVGRLFLTACYRPHITIDAPLAPGETVLLCSDGLTDMVADQIISDTLRTKSPLRSARKLAAEAFSAGARDNISLIVVRWTDVQNKYPASLRGTDLYLVPE